MEKEKNMNKNLHLEMKMVLKTFNSFQSNFTSLIIRSIKDHKGLEEALGLSPESGLYKFKLEKGFGYFETLRILDLWKEKPNLFHKDVISESDGELEKMEQMTKDVFEFIHKERYKAQKKKEESERKRISRKFDIENWKKSSYQVKECACCKNTVKAVFYPWNSDGLIYNCSTCNMTIREKANNKVVKLPIPNIYNKELDNLVKYGTEKTYVKKEYKQRVIDCLSNFSEEVLESLQNKKYYNCNCKHCKYPVKSVEFFGKKHYSSCEFCGVYCYEDFGYVYSTPNCVSELTEYAIVYGFVKD